MQTKVEPDQRAHRQHQPQYVNPHQDGEPVQRLAHHRSDARCLERMQQAQHRLLNQDECARRKGRAKPEHQTGCADDAGSASRAIGPHGEAPLRAEVDQDRGDNQRQLERETSGSQPRPAARGMNSSAPVRALSTSPDRQRARGWSGDVGGRLLGQQQAQHAEARHQGTAHDQW